MKTILILPLCASLWLCPNVPQCDDAQADSQCPRTFRDTVANRVSLVTDLLNTIDQETYVPGEVKTLESDGRAEIVAPFEAADGRYAEIRFLVFERPETAQRWVGAPRDDSSAAFQEMRAEAQKNNGKSTVISPDFSERMRQMKGAFALKCYSTWRPYPLGAQGVCMYLLPDQAVVMTVTEGSRTAKLEKWNAAQQTEFVSLAMRLYEIPALEFAADLKQLSLMKP